MFLSDSDSDPDSREPSPVPMSEDEMKTPTAKMTRGKGSRRESSAKVLCFDLVTCPCTHVLFNVCCIR